MNITEALKYLKEGKQVYSKTLKKTVKYNEPESREPNPLSFLDDSSDFWVSMNNYFFYSAIETTDWEVIEERGTLDYWYNKLGEDVFYLKEVPDGSYSVTYKVELLSNKLLPRIYLCEGNEFGQESTSNLSSNSYEYFITQEFTLFIPNSIMD